MGTHPESLRRRPVSRIRTAAAIAAAACAAGLISAPVSTGQGGMSAGGALAPEPPTIRDVICERGCVGLRSPTVGGLVQVSGKDLGSVTKMMFPGAEKRIAANVVDATETTAAAVVPEGAMDGTVRVRDDFGNASNHSPAKLDIRPVEELGSAGELTLAEAQTSPRRAYFFGVRAPRLDYVIGSSQPLNDLRIDIVSGQGEIVRSFFRNDVEANTSQTIRWNGKTSAGGPAPNGGYQFAIRSQAGRRATRSRAAAGGLGFRLYGHIFPVRGPHTYGDGIGAPRAGHTHQGLDVFAECGTRMVAARGGKVQYSGYHGSAGNYIVIDGRNSGFDYVYMHLLTPSPHRTGSTVRTGEVIGKVGETGNASGCHLHYEMWAAPGWYEGGSFVDPVPHMKKWDRYS